ncbi:MAG: 50S ribosomal protein L25 [Patescibacteria group bacterium]|jgi:large subunit ribosomal protein L25
MEKHVLNIEKRTLFGKKLKKLRRENKIPGNIFGKGMQSIAVQMGLADLQKTYKKVKNTQLVYLTLAKDEYPVLIQEVQKDSIKNGILHVDFRKVNLKEKVSTLVPVEIVGELGVVKSGEADMLILSHEITIECLPANIPEKITVSIASLPGIGSGIKIKDLPKNDLYAYADEPEKSVVEIVAAQKEEIPVPVAPTATEGAPVAEGAAPAGDAKADEKEEKGKSEEKKK